MQTSQQPPVSRESGDHEPQRGQSPREALRGTSREALRPFPRAEEPQPRETIQTRGDIPLTLTHREAEQGEPGSLMSRFSLSERGVLGQQRAFSPLGTVSAAEQRRALQERSIAGSQANWNGTPASLVHRSEEKVAIPSPQAEEDFVGIPTVRTTRTGQRSQQVQQVVTQDIQPAGDRLTLTGENSPLIQAQIEKMADRVYKVIENRLRQEKFRRGMW